MRTASLALLKSYHHTFPNCTGHRLFVQAEQKEVKAAIAGRRSDGPRRPRMTAEEIDAAIGDLEYQRSTQNLSMADERKLLQEVTDLKRQKRSLGHFAIEAASVDGLYDRRREIGTQLSELFQQLDELRAGLSVVDRIERISAVNSGVEVTPSQLLQREIKVPSASVGRLIGRGGASVAVLEAESKCSVEVNSKPNTEGECTVVLSGLSEAALDAAVQLVEEQSATDEKTITAPRGLLALLTSQKGERMQNLEAEHLVRIQLHRKDGTATLQGHPRRMAAAEAAINIFKERSATVAVATATVPAIIGKNGCNFRELQSDLGVEVERVTSAESEVEAGCTLLQVWGDSHTAVTEAIARLKAMEEEHTEHSVTHDVSRELVFFLLADSGSRVKELRSAHHVLVNVEQPREGQATVTFRGTEAQLGKLNEDWTALLADFDVCVKVITVPAAVAVTVIGNSGGRLGAMRDEHPGVAINVVVNDEGGANGRRGGARDAERHGVSKGEAVIIIRSSEAEKTQAAAAAVQAVIDSFATRSLTMPHFVAATMMHDRAAKLQALQSKHGARVDLTYGEPLPGQTDGGGKGGRRGPPKLRHPASVVLVGEQDAVDAAAAELEQLCSENTESKVEFPTEDCMLAFIGRGGSNIKAFTKEVNSAVRGAQTAEAADPEATDDGEVSAEETGEATATEEDAADPAAAAPKAKGSSTKQASKNKTNAVEISVFQPLQCVFLSGASDAVAVAAAKATEWVTKYNAENASVPVPSDMLSTIIGKGGSNLKKMTADTGCEFNVDRRSGTVRITGPADKLQGGVDALVAVSGAELHFEEMTGIPLEGNVVAVLVGKKGASLKELEQETGTHINIQEAKNYITLRGSLEGIARAKIALRRKLRDGVTVTKSVAMPGSCVRPLLAKGAALLRGIEADSGARVDVPQSARRPATSIPGVAIPDSRVHLSVRGSTEAAARAETALLALAQGKTVAMLPLLASHLGYLAGKCKRNMERLEQSHGVTVELQGAPGQELGAANTEDGGVQSMLGAAAAPAAGGAAAQADSASAAALAALAAEAAEPGLATVIGSEGGVATAVAALHRLLEFNWREQFQNVPTPDTMLAQMLASPARRGGGGASAEVGSADANGATVPAEDELREGIPSLDLFKAQHTAVHVYACRITSSVVLAGRTADDTAAAVDALVSAKSKWAQRHAEVALAEWMMGPLVGKGGSSIKKLEAAAKCRLSVERHGASPVIALAGRTHEEVTAGKAVVQARVDELQATRAEIRVAGGAVASLIGKGGSTITALQADTGCSIRIGDRNDDSSAPVLVQIRGNTAEATAAGKAAVMAHLDTEGFPEGQLPERSSQAHSIPLPNSRDAPGYIIGKGGATVRKLQEDTGASISVDRENGEVLIEGNEEQVAAAVAAVDKLLQEVKASSEARSAARGEERGPGGGGKGGSKGPPNADSKGASAAAEKPSEPHIPVGTPADEVAAIRAAAAYKGMNKAARRKEKKRAEKLGQVMGSGPEADELLAQLADLGAADAAASAAPAGSSADTEAAAAEASAAEELLAYLGAFSNGDSSSAAAPVHSAPPVVVAPPAPASPTPPGFESEEAPLHESSPAPTRASSGMPPGLFSPTSSASNVVPPPGFTPARPGKGGRASGVGSSDPVMASLAGVLGDAPVKGSADDLLSKPSIDALALLLGDSGSQESKAPVPTEAPVARVASGAAARRSAAGTGGYRRSNGVSIRL